MAFESRSNQYGNLFDGWHITKKLGGNPSEKTMVYQLSRENGIWEEICALKVITLIEETGVYEQLSPSRQEEYNRALKQRINDAMQEVRLMEKLRGNTNIVDYLDHGPRQWRKDNRFGCDMLIRMELLHDLRSEIANRRIFSEAEILKIGKDICNALVLCHGKDILHRDIKPENIFFNDDGNYKLGDFGISRILDSCPDATASTGIGTYEYSPAEQMRGRYDKRVDLYSLGLVLYELGNHNRLPFAQSSYLTGLEVPLRLAGKPLPAPSDVSPALAQVILKACAFLPEDRYQSAEEFLNALNGVGEMATVPAAQEVSPEASEEPAARGELVTVLASNPESAEKKSENHQAIPTSPQTQKASASPLAADQGKAFGTVPAQQAPLQSKREEKKNRRQAYSAFAACLVILIGVMAFLLWMNQSKSEPENTLRVNTLPTGEDTLPETAPPPTIPSTQPPETVPPTTLPPQTVPATSQLSETASVSTQPPETVPVTTLPPETVPATTQPSQTAPEPTVPATEPPETISDWSTIFAYEQNATGLTITGFKDESIRNCVIPSTIDGVPVTRIAACVFYSCTNLESISIPNSVTSIESAAFEACHNLRSVTLPDSITHIGAHTFQSCGGLPSITIPDGVTSIGVGAFYNCTNLSKITLPDGLSTIGASAFRNCSSLSNISIPDSVVSIGDSAFYDCASLRNIDLPNGLTSIEDSMFCGCESLTSVSIPRSVTSIGISAFLRCGSLRSITIPGSVTLIGNSSFSECGSLYSITISDGVTSIEDGAFSGCENLSVIDIPDSVTRIGSGAFSRCYSLRSIRIPDRVTEIESSLFFSCTSLTSVSIPDGITSIGDCAFCYCPNLTSVNIPDGVTYIDKNAFRGCESLSSITIPDSVTSIGESAFDSCEGLSSITIPDSVITIGPYTFSGCIGLSSVTISRDCAVGEKAFPPTCQVLYY